MDEEDTFDYVTSVILSTPTSKRIRSSSESDISPEVCKPRKRIMSEYKDLNTKLDDEAVGVRDLLKCFLHHYQQDMASIRADIITVKSNMVTQTKLSEELSKVRSEINTSTKALKDELTLDIATVTSKVERVEKNFSDLSTSYEHQILELQARLNKVESGTVGADFPIDTTCVVTGLKYEVGEDLHTKCSDLVHNALSLKDVQIKNTMRTPMRNGKPGLVKVEFYNKNDKILVLQNKRKLNEISHLKLIRFRSSLSHEQRLLQQHTMELLRLQGKEQEYFFNGSGKLIKKAYPGLNTNSGVVASNADLITLVNGLSEKLNSMATQASQNNVH